MNQELAANDSTLMGQEISEYVAELQVHMTLHARNLVPPLQSTTISHNRLKQNTVKPNNDSREQLIRETQAQLEKLISRQRLD